MSKKNNDNIIQARTYIKLSNIENNIEEINDKLNLLLSLFLEVEDDECKEEE